MNAAAQPQATGTHNEDRKVALVTGGSRGIGAAIAERLANDGFAVIVNFAGRASEAEALVARIVKAGGRAVAAQADVSDPAAVTRMFDTAETAFGGVDVLVNSAGIMKVVTLAETTDEIFDQQVAINLKGTFNTLREAARRLRNGGRIVNVSSSVVGLYQPMYAAYAATKAGVEAMTHVLTKELRGRDITVNTVAPGPIATQLFFEGKTDEVIARYAKAPPLERLGKPEEVASVVAMLAGPDGSWVNGQTIRVNGGVV